MKLAAGFAALFTASTQGLATAGEVASAPVLALPQLPSFLGQNLPNGNFPGPQAQAAPFDFRNLALPPEFIFQSVTSIPIEWWQQGSSSPLAVVIGNAEGTRSLDGSMTPAYYWHRDPGNGANNFGSFSFQHLSPQETAGVLDQPSWDARRSAAANQALPEVADQRQLVKLRRFHDLLQLQAQRHGIQLTNLELINGLDLATQSELAGLDAWGYVDRLVQIKATVTDPEEQIIRARTWSYWDPVQNRWAAPGLGNTEYYIRRDQARRFEAVKQALLYQNQRPSLLQEVDLAWARNAPASEGQESHSVTSHGDDAWAIALLNQPNALEGSSFNRQPLQLEAASNGLDRLLAETTGAETVLADAIAANATVAVATPTDLRPEDLDLKGELNRARNQVAPQLSASDAIEVAQGLDRPLALETDAEPAWERLAMTPEEFALATAIASPSLDSAASLSLANATEALETAAIARALEASVIAASVETAEAIAQVNLPGSSLDSPQAEVNPTSPASPAAVADSGIPVAERLSSGADNSVPAIEALNNDLGVIGDINQSLLTVQPFIPAELRALPLEPDPAPEPKTAAVKPGQPFQNSPQIVQLAAMAHVQAAEPVISDRIKSQAFLDLASGLKESPIAVLDESLGLAIATEAPAEEPAVKPALDLANEPWPTPEMALETEAPPVEPIIPPDIQAMLAQSPQPAEAEQSISETVVFFEENLSDAD